MTKGRDITVTGPRGTLNKNFSHLSLDLTHKTGGTNSNGQAVGGSIRVDMWFGTKKQIACIRTICAAIENMVREGGVGWVSRGYAPEAGHNQQSKLFI